MNEHLMQIAIGDLIPDPNQPRQVFSQDAIDRLALSIAARGVLQPLRVMRDDERLAWRVVAGESRLRAAKQAGLTTVGCVVVEGEPSEEEILSDQIIENHCREDLRPLDLARALAKLKRLKGCTAQALASELGLSGASITRAEALLTLPDDVQAMVDDGRLSESAAYEISRLKDADAMRLLASETVYGRKSRDQVADAVRQRVGKRNVPPKAGRVTGKLADGVAFTFSFASGELTPQTLIAAIEQIRSKLRDMQKAAHPDVSALPELLRVS